VAVVAWSTAATAAAAGGGATARIRSTLFRVHRTGRSSGRLRRAFVFYILLGSSRLVLLFIAKKQLLQEVVFSVGCRIVVTLLNGTTIIQRRSRRHGAGRCGSRDSSWRWHRSSRR
jgi:hypothetical protein